MNDTWDDVLSAGAERSNLKAGDPADAPSIMHCPVKTAFSNQTLWVYTKIIPIAQVLTKYFLEFFNRGIKPIFKSAAVRTVYAFVGYDALESVPL